MEVFYKKAFLKLSQNSQRNTVLESLPNTIKGLQVVRLATL